MSIFALLTPKKVGQYSPGHFQSTRPGCLPLLFPSEPPGGDVASRGTLRSASFFFRRLFCLVFGSSTVTRRLLSLSLIPRITPLSIQLARTVDKCSPLAPYLHSSRPDARGCVPFNPISLALPTRGGCFRMMEKSFLSLYFTLFFFFFFSFVRSPPPPSPSPLSLWEKGAELHGESCLGVLHKLMLSKKLCC